MKKQIHPPYGPVVFRDQNTGALFVTRSTLAQGDAHETRETVLVEGEELPVINVEISSDSHPFWTGQARVLDSEGRVEQFNRRYGRGRRA